MSRLDLVVFGATGFTGKQAVLYLVNYAKKYEIGSWGVAGRSIKKLEEVIADVTKKTGEDLSHVRRIEADVGDERSLQAMCAQATVLVNCCGPYRLYGAPVVKAAVENGTNYVDVTGEPHFMETTQLLYDQKAREAGIYVISACGWDSIPADMGVTFLKQNFLGTLNSVESYIKTWVAPEFQKEAKERGVIGSGTWESVIYGIESLKEMPELEKKLFPEPLPPLKPKLKQRNLQKKNGKWYLPFPGADESVIYRTQRFLHQYEQHRPIQFQAYFEAGGLGTSILLIFAAAFLFILAKFSCTRKSLVNNPKFWTGGRVTKQGPSDNVMKNTHFVFELVGKGWDVGANTDETEPNKTVIARVSGTNPAYGATLDALLMSAHTVLKERHNMPGSGGVMTPGSAFKNTTLIQKLNENNLKFEIVSTNLE